MPIYIVTYQNHTRLVAAKNKASAAKFIASQVIKSEVAEPREIAEHAAKGVKIEEAGAE